MQKTRIALRCHQPIEKLASPTFRVATSAWYCFATILYLLTISYHWLLFGKTCMLLQPNCAEPWTEVIFADDKEGKVQVQ